MIDCIIVGSGVAAISAALTLQSNRKSVMIFGTGTLSDKISKAEKIHNYPGLADVSGKEFCEALQNQLRQAELAITQETVSGVYALKDKFSVMTQQGNLYESRTVIVACGVESVKQIEGETEFVGRGVSYCATCDGFLYKDKTIAVVCTTKRLEHEISYLADFAKKVHLIAMYKDVEIQKENVEIIRKMPQKISGGLRVNGLVFADGELAVDGVFMLRESVSPAVLVGGLQMEDNHVAVDRTMATNLPGCFAAGDCTGRPYQYAKAVGEGNIAAHSVSAFLSALK